MIPQRITVKFFVESPDELPLSAFIPVFHRWIQEEAAPGLLIDIVDYEHVHEGPGVILIGHEGDYALDLGDGRNGLLYRGKRDWPEAGGEPVVQSRLRHAIQRALEAVVILEAEPLLELPLTFRGDEIEIQFVDRLHTPNDQETAERLRDDVATVLDALYPGLNPALTWIDSEPRRPLAFRVTTSNAPRPEKLLENLSQTTAIRA